MLFESHSLEHVSRDESYTKPAKNSKSPFHYFQIHSIEVYHDSKLFVSARKTSTV